MMQLHLQENRHLKTDLLNLRFKHNSNVNLDLRSKSNYTHYPVTQFSVIKDLTSGCVNTRLIFKNFERFCLRIRIIAYKFEKIFEKESFRFKVGKHLYNSAYNSSCRNIFKLQTLIVELQYNSPKCSNDNKISNEIYLLKTL